MLVKRISPFLLALVAVLFLNGWNCNSEAPAPKNDVSLLMKQEQEKKRQICIAYLDAIIRGEKNVPEACYFGGTSFESLDVSSRAAETLDVFDARIGARNLIYYSAGKEIRLNAMLLAPMIILDAPKIDAAGYIAAGDFADIRCTQCNLDETLFFGPDSAWWYLNHNRCVVKDHKLVCPDEEQAKQQRQKCIGFIERIPLKLADLNQVGECGYGDFADINTYRAIPYARIENKAFQYKYIKLEKFWTKITLDVVMVANEIKLHAPLVFLKGFYFALDSGSIECQECNLEGALFFGENSWTLNGKPCTIDSDHHLQCK